MPLKGPQGWTRTSVCRQEAHVGMSRTLCTKDPNPVCLKEGLALQIYIKVKTFQRAVQSRLEVGQRKHMGICPACSNLSRISRALSTPCPQCRDESEGKKMTFRGLDLEKS